MTKLETFQAAYNDSKEAWLILNSNDTLTEEEQISARELICDNLSQLEGYGIIDEVQGRALDALITGEEYDDEIDDDDGGDDDGGSDGHIDDDDDDGDGDDNDDGEEELGADDEIEITLTEGQRRSLRDLFAAYLSNKNTAPDERMDKGLSRT